MYEVGQVLYTILEDKFKVIPLKVTEQVITKTLENESISYKAVLPNSKTKKIDLSKLKNIHTSLDNVKDYLTNNAISAIETMLNETKDVEKKYFKINNECKKETINDIIIEDKTEKIKIELSDGQKANIDLNSIQSLLDQKKNEEKSINT